MEWVWQLYPAAGYNHELFLLIIACVLLLYCACTAINNTRTIIHRVCKLLKLISRHTTTNKLI